MKMNPDNRTQQTMLQNKKNEKIHKKERKYVLKNDVPTLGGANIIKFVVHFTVLHKKNIINISRILLSVLNLWII